MDRAKAAKASRAKAKMRAHSPIRMASRARTAIQVSKEISRITARVNSRTVANRAASKEIRRAETRMVTIRTVRTSSSRDRPKEMTRDSRDPRRTSSRASS